MHLFPVTNRQRDNQRQGKSTGKEIETMGNVETCLDACEPVKENSLSVPASPLSRRFRPKWRHTHHQQEHTDTQVPFPGSYAETTSHRQTWHHGARWRDHKQATNAPALHPLRSVDLMERGETAQETTSRTEVEHLSDKEEAKEHSRRCHPLTSLRKTSVRALSKTGHAVCHIVKSCEDFLFPRHIHPGSNQPAVKHCRYQPVLLEGCATVEEHNEKLSRIHELVRDMHGADGLRAMGLEYRVVPCDAHQNNDSAASSTEGDRADNDYSGNIEEEEGEDEDLSGVFLPRRSPSQPSLVPTSEVTSSFRTAEMANLLEQRQIDEVCDKDRSTLLIEESGERNACRFCQRHLFHMDTDTMIDEQNRKKYIADGDMYEDAARLCQETAHDIMREECNLEWVTVEDSLEDGHTEPIRLLVSKAHPLASNRETKSDRPTLLIATGRGKVRAGIFSRKFLMCGGLESSTAIPMIRESISRNMHVLIVDPNVHGEANGFITYTKSLDFYSRTAMGDLYMLSHSASGGHMARYLLNRSKFLSRIRAIAFTDSTHNIQWTKPKQPPTTKATSTIASDIESNRSELNHMLQSDRCVYFRCANPRDSQWYIHAAGDPVRTDNFWEHRFGSIRTLWAGTDEHSLTNWFAHAKIWEHFDGFLQDVDSDE